MIIKSTRPATREELIQIIDKLEKQLNKEKEKNKKLEERLAEIELQILEDENY